MIDEELTADGRLMPEGVTYALAAARYRLSRLEARDLERKATHGGSAGLSQADDDDIAGIRRVLDDLAKTYPKEGKLRAGKGQLRVGTRGHRSEYPDAGRPAGDPPAGVDQ